MQCIQHLLKQAITAAESENFTAAKSIQNEIEDIANAQESEEMKLQALELKEYIQELEQNKGDWLAQWYAGSAGGVAKRRVKNGRFVTIKLG
ncbi:TPA: hypothetical protein P7L52_003265 [Vibrio cholerae]|uniref:hypothetical protein n=1 Tax=Vibrio cholerae TaxID=666 RepID=UPI001A1B67F0|nr:hypothetical protein [Vibrio cholerae]EJL6311041.1 hypothetical protein [Vibrio cholerae]EJL6419608.1 hypothetical protein [Vibrio cholerae]EJL6582235.1 hypothetical protein [Vibrio cholerae]EKF9121510.1 hypothetical protein [Vibrio cholerae]